MSTPTDRQRAGALRTRVAELTQACANYEAMKAGAEIRIADLVRARDDLKREYDAMETLATSEVARAMQAKRRADAAEIQVQGLTAAILGLEVGVAPSSLDRPCWCYRTGIPPWKDGIVGGTPAHNPPCAAIRAALAATTAGELRCTVTGHLCGTDTVAVGAVPDCPACAAWLRAPPPPNEARRLRDFITAQRGHGTVDLRCFDRGHQYRLTEFDNPGLAPEMCCAWCGRRGPPAAGTGGDPK